MPIPEGISATQTQYVCKSIPGKGQGLIATANLLAGTRILAESPLITVSRATYDKAEIRKSIVNQLSALSEGQRQAYFSLSNVHGKEDGNELGIARTNALPLGSNAAQGAVFLEASRINHACNSNSQNTWNESTQKLTIHATRDIRQGEEITIYYLDKFSKRSARQSKLRAAFGFACHCDLCSCGEEQRMVSDRRLEEIQSLDDRIGNGARLMSSPLCVLQDVRKLLALLREEGIAGTSEARAYYDGFQVAVTHGDLARAGELAKRSSTARAVAEGDDSPQVQRLNRLAADPSKHVSYGLSKQWETTLGSCPHELNAQDFESWLWRKKAESLSPLADLRNEGSFPAFDSLPDENDVDLEFFDTADGFSYRPRKHWCFLAEIVDIEDFLRLGLTVKDRAGRTTRILFYTDSRGREMSPSQLRQGYTVAVLYAEQHGFLDLSVGIRHEDPKYLKVRPTSIKSTLPLTPCSDYSNRLGGAAQAERSRQEAY